MNTKWAFMTVSQYIEAALENKDEKELFDYFAGKASGVLEVAYLMGWVGKEYHDFTEDRIINLHSELEK